MKKVLATIVCCLSLLTVSLDADAARRFGGSGSKGRTSSALFQKAPANKPVQGGTDSVASKQMNGSTATQKVQNQATPPKPQSSFMRKALTGIAAALGIAALLSMLGIDASSLMGMIASVAMMALIAFAIVALIGMFRKKQPVAMATPNNVMQSSSNATQMSGQSVQQQSLLKEAPTRSGSVLESLSNFDFANGQLQAQQNESMIQAQVGENFDQMAFLRASKKYYKMFQEAWAKGDITSVSRYWDNELYIAMTHELARRKGEVYTLEMVNLDAQLLGAMRENGRLQVAVFFSGALRINGRMEEIKDLWVMEKPAEEQGGWLVIGTKACR